VAAPPPGPPTAGVRVWATGATYAVNDHVNNGDAIYRCTTAHTAGTFATDLATKWVRVSSSSGATGLVQTSDGAGGLSSTAGLSYSTGSSLLTVPSITTTGAEWATGAITPAAITADVNNYAPAGFSAAAVIRASGDQPYRAITGLAGGADGRRVLLENAGSVPLLVRNQNTSSTATNRFSFPYDIRLDPSECLAVRYDGTLSRWVGSPVAGPSDVLAPGGSVVLFDDFISQSGVSGSIGALGWTTSGGGIGPGTPSQGVTIGQIRLSSTAVSGAITFMTLGSSGTVKVLSLGDLDEVFFRVKAFSGTADFTTRFGLMDALNIAQPAAGVYFEKLDADATWFAVARDAGTQTRTTTGVSATDGLFHTFLIRQSAGVMTFQVDRSAAAVTINTNVSVAATNFAIGYTVVPAVAAARSIDLDTFSLRSQPMPNRW
jgi:hypothetical protein